MKYIVSVLLLLQVIIAESQQNKDATIIRYESTYDAPGIYRFVFQTSNGIIQEQIGRLKTTNGADQITQVEGMYSYFAPDNSFHKVEYIADENGYRAGISEPGKTPNIEGIPSINDLHRGETTTLEPENEDRLKPVPLDGSAIKTLAG